MHDRTSSVRSSLSKSSQERDVRRWRSLTLVVWVKTLSSISVNVAHDFYSKNKSASHTVSRDAIHRKQKTLSKLVPYLVILKG